MPFNVCVHVSHPPPVGNDTQCAQRWVCDSPIDTAYYRPLLNRCRLFLRRQWACPWRHLSHHPVRIIKGDVIKRFPYKCTTPSIQSWERSMGTSVSRFTRKSTIQQQYKAMKHYCNVCDTTMYSAGVGLVQNDTRKHNTIVQALTPSHRWGALLKVPLGKVIFTVIGALSVKSDTSTSYRFKVRCKMGHTNSETPCIVG